jgi:hypothetical protein
MLGTKIAYTDEFRIQAGKRHSWLLSQRPRPGNRKVAPRKHGEFSSARVCLFRAVADLNVLGRSRAARPPVPRAHPPRISLAPLTSSFLADRSFGPPYEFAARGRSRLSAIWQDSRAEELFYAL